MVGQLTFNTVRKVVRSGATEHSYKRTNQPQPQLIDYVDRIEELLKENWKRPRKRRKARIRRVAIFP